MNQIGLHVCYLRGTEYELNMVRAIPLVRSLGADVFEMSVGTLLNYSQTERRELARIARDQGLTLTVNGGMDLSNDAAADDPRIRSKGVEFCKRALQATNDVGAELFCGINYSAWLRRPERLLTRDEKSRIWDLSLQSMRQVLPTAENLGIDYCFEIVNRFEMFLLNTAEEGVRFTQQTGSKRAKILLDTYHMNIEEDSISDAILTAQQAGVLGHLHLGESNRRIPGSGKTHMDWDGIFATIRDSGYSGKLVLEPFVRMGLPTSMNTCVWRPMTKNTSLEEYLNDAKNGFCYLRSKMEMLMR